VPATALDEEVAEAIVASPTEVLKTENFCVAVVPAEGTSVVAAVCNAEIVPCSDPSAEILA
jgi:hypothetical protein